MEETFAYDDMNRLTGITLKRPSGQDLYCAATYDAFGRMTSKEAVLSVNGTPQVTSFFSLPAFDATKIHALTQVRAPEGVFPSTAQTVTYTGFDKVSKVKQGNDSLCYTYGYDHQRILMEEHVGNRHRTKRYVGNCEYITKTNGNDTEEQWLTYLTSSTGIYAVVMTKSGRSQLFYVLKDNLGSWTTITDENGEVEQRLNYDAWGNLRNPNYWTGFFSSVPMFDRGFTGHEHLYAFGLINMNGRMYDPLMSSFLSPDNYIQDPTTQQGFNRYAYCAYNPLKYVDPSGEQYFGWDPGLAYRMEQEARAIVRSFWQQCYDSAMASHYITIAMANCLFSHGQDTQGNGSGNHGSPGGGSNQNGPSGNGHGDGNPTNTSNSSANEKPGSSENNPITEGNLSWICYVHYMTGERETLHVSVSILCLDNLSYNDFICDEKTGNLSINLFSSKMVYPDIQTALALGKITLIPQENGMYKVHDDTYDFNYELKPNRWDYGVFDPRNLETGVAGLLHGNFYNIPIRTTPALFFGGPFKINFVGEIYIPNNP